jgi:monoamine oxidase
MKRLRRDQSFADFIAAHKRLDARTVRMAMAYVEGFNAADARRISAKSIVQAEADADEIEGTKLYRLIDGYDGVVRWLTAGADPQRIEFRLGRIVTNVAWTNGRVTVAARSRDGDEQTWTAPVVVITLPLGVLKEGAVEFSPPIQAKQDALAKLESGPVVKVVLRFDQAFWDTGEVPAAGERLTEAGLIHADLGERGIAFPTWWTMAAARVPVLVGWVGGPQALEVSGGPDERVRAHAVESLARLFGMQATQVERGLQAFRVADWQHDPFARGAYSYVAVGGAGAVEALAEPLQQTLFFAGEATHPGMSGTVAGAIASGYRAADEILAHRH